MKKLVLSFILIISSFMIYNQNVLAWAHSVTLSSYEAHVSGSTVTNMSTFTANFQDFYFYGIKTNSNSNFSGFNTATINFSVNNPVNGIGYIAFTTYYQSSDDNAPTIRVDGNTCTLQSQSTLEIPLSGPSTHLANYSCYGYIGDNHTLSVGGQYLSFFAISSNIDISGAESDLLSKLDELKTAIQNISLNPQNIQEIKNNTKETNDLIKNDNIDNNSANSSASSWNSKNASNGVITQLLTLPINLLTAIVNGIQISCSNFSLGSLFNTNIVLPCIDISNYIGVGLFATIDLLISGFMIYNISKKLIKIFNDFTNLKSNQIDEIYGGGNS